MPILILFSFKILAARRITEYSDRDKAVLLNDYFSSVFTIDNGVIDTTKLPHKVDDVMPKLTFHSIHGCQVY